MRSAFVTLSLLVVVLAGCGKPPPAPVTPAPVAPPASTPTPPPPSPQPPASMRLWPVGDTYELRGLPDQPQQLVWAPSGQRAIVLVGERRYLADLPSLTLTPIAGLGLVHSFWSEQEVAWSLDVSFLVGSMQLHNLETGADRQLFPVDAASPAAQAELVGRMRSGKVLARTERELLAVSPSGEVERLGAGKNPVLSADGSRALWFAGPSTDLGAGVTTLVIWDDRGTPARIPLGGTFAAQGAFSLDGRRVALALNNLTPGQPGQIALYDGKGVQPLTTGENGVSLWCWVGERIAFSYRVLEKTGGGSIIFLVDGQGKLANAPFLLSGNPMARSDGSTTELTWIPSGAQRRVAGNFAIPLGAPSPTDPFALFIERGRIVLRPLLP